MFVITDKSNAVLCFSNTEVQDGEYVRLDTCNYMANAVNVYEKADISNIKILVNCFDGTNVITNPNYIEPEVNITQIQSLQAQVASLLPNSQPVANPVTVSDYQKNKIAEMTNAYNQAITNTFTSTAFDGTTVETYACDAISQSRMNGETTASMAVLQGYSSEIISWKNTSQAQCETWQPKNMINLFNDLHKFLTTQTDYMEKLGVYIMSLTDVNSVNVVVWGMTIPTTAS